jgi:hypothetical protein
VLRVVLADPPAVTDPEVGLSLIEKSLVAVPSCLSAVLLPVVQAPETIRPRRALDSRRFGRVSRRPCWATCRMVEVATTTNSEW